MDLPDSNSFRNKKSLSPFLLHSCLGQLILSISVLLVLFVIACITNPSGTRMKTEMWDNIRQSIESDDPLDQDGIDVFVNNLSYTFSSADTLVNEELRREFLDNNDTLFFNHLFFSTMYVNNHYGMKPERCGIGIFGMVIPTANFKRFLPQDIPYSVPGEQLLPAGDGGDEYYGETPVDIFRYEGE